MIGFHFQRAVNDWPRAVAELPPGTPIKAVDNVQMLSEAKSVNPGVVTILRHWYDPDQRFEGDYDNRARAFLRTFVDGTFDQHAHNVDFIEGWNEYLANSQNAAEIAERVKWVEALCRVWGTEYRTHARYGHIRLIVANAAVGNDIPLEMARVAHEWDAVLGYHPYMPWKDGARMPGEAPHYSQRWQEMDARYRAAGIRCDWMFTEFGPLNYVVNPAGGVHLDGGGGWRHKDVCNGNVMNYLDSLGEMIDAMAAWNQQHDGRALGAVLFTTNGNATEVWRSFETAQPEMDQIAAFVGFYSPDPPTPPTIPPDPEPEPEPEEPIVINHTEVHTTLMRSFNDGEPSSLKIRTMYHTGAGIRYTAWQDVPIPALNDIRGFEMRALVEKQLTVDPPAVVEPEPDIVPYGVDVSHWQGDMDWHKAAAAGVNFAFIKATESDYHRDRLFNANRDGAAAAGILWGAYHFYRFGIDPQKQAALFIDQIAGDWGDLPPVADVEDTKAPFDAAELKRFLDLVEAAAGVRPIIYTGSWYWPGGVEWAKHYMLWEAEYNGGAEPAISRDWADWTFHQYTNSGDGPTHGASSAKIDLNKFNGTWRELVDLTL